MQTTNNSLVSRVQAKGESAPAAELDDSTKSKKPSDCDGFDKIVLITLYIQCHTLTGVNINV